MNMFNVPLITYFYVITGFLTMDYVPWNRTFPEKKVNSFPEFQIFLIFVWLDSNSTNEWIHFSPFFHVPESNGDLYLSLKFHLFPVLYAINNFLALTSLKIIGFASERRTKVNKSFCFSKAFFSIFSILTFLE